MQVFDDNYKLSSVRCGIANAAQPHALNMPLSGFVIVSYTLQESEEGKPEQN